jgi:hypothetical protein
MFLNASQAPEPQVACRVIRMPVLLPVAAVLVVSSLAWARDKETVCFPLFDASSTWTKVLFDLLCSPRYLTCPSLIMDRDSSRKTIETYQLQTIFQGAVPTNMGS